MLLSKRKISPTWSHRLKLWRKRRIQKWWKIKIGSNKFCFRNDLAKKNMMISQESCQAIIEIGNEELIELKKSRVQCPSCLYTMYLREQLYIHVENTSDPTKRWFSASGKLLRYSRRLSFVHLIRIREVTSMDLNCGNSIITNQMMPCELLQGRKTEPLRIFGVDGKTIWNKENRKKPLVGTMRLCDISTTSYRLTSLLKHLLNNEAGLAIWCIFVV